MQGVPVVSADVQNSYLQSPTSEKHFIICGPELRLSNIVKKTIITRALYGRKSAGRDFWYHLMDCIKYLGFESSCADTYV